MLIIVDPSFFGGVAAILRSICVPVSECPTYFNQLSFAHGKWPKLWWKIPRNPQILHLLLAVAVLKSWKLQDQKASDLLDTRLNNLILGLDKKDFPMRELLQVNPGFVWRPGCFFLGVVPMWMAFAFIKLGGGNPPGSINPGLTLCFVEAIPSEKGGPGSWRIFNHNFSDVLHNCTSVFETLQTCFFQDDVLLNMAMGYITCFMCWHSGWELTLQNGACLQRYSWSAPLTLSWPVDSLGLFEFMCVHDLSCYFLGTWNLWEPFKRKCTLYRLYICILHLPFYHILSISSVATYQSIRIYLLVGVSKMFFYFQP